MSLLAFERSATVPPDFRRELENHNTVPLYVVCSPRRGIGKTLLARLLCEFFSGDRRTVTAIDMADEGPQLTDFLPTCTRPADISDIGGQMALFDRLIADRRTIRVIDVSHRTFKPFFVVAQNIAFFDEARRCGIDPIILFPIDSDPVSAQAYAILRRWFPGTTLLPVRNNLFAHGARLQEAFPNESAIPVSLEIPLLAGSLRTLLNQPTFSLSSFWQSPPVGLPAKLDDELHAWMKRIYRQFRELEVCRIGDEIKAALE
jgi:hypothetical protein